MEVERPREGQTWETQVGQRKVWVDSLRSGRYIPLMPFASSNERVVAVREIPIELCQFLKFGGLASSGGEAKQLIGEGSVLLNGAVETRKRKKLTIGDRVTVEGQSIIVQLD